MHFQTGFFSWKGKRMKGILKVILQRIENITSNESCDQKKESDLSDFLKKEFLNENRARIFNLNSMDQVQQLKILEYYFLNTEPLNHAISVQTFALSLAWNHLDCFFVVICKQSSCEFIIKSECKFLGLHFRRKHHIPMRTQILNTGKLSLFNYTGLISTS